MLMSQAPPDITWPQRLLFAAPTLVEHHLEAIPAHLERHLVARADGVAQVRLAGVRAEGELWVDCSACHSVVVVFEAIGEEDTNYVLHLLLAQIHLQLHKEEVDNHLEADAHGGVGLEPGGGCR